MFPTSSPSTVRKRISSCRRKTGDWSWDREATLRNVKANYCAMVKHLDDCVGKARAELESQGILDETLVIFTTDRGPDGRTWYDRQELPL